MLPLDQMPESLNQYAQDDLTHSDYEYDEEIDMDQMEEFVADDDTANGVEDQQSNRGMIRLDSDSDQDEEL